jgi:hypothetical protein
MLWLVLLPILWLPLLLLLLWFSVGVNFVVSLVAKGVAMINAMSLSLLLLLLLLWLLLLLLIMMMMQLLLLS